MKIKTYQRIRIFIMLLFTAVFAAAVAYSVKQLDLYNKSEVTTGKVIALGTNWTGGTWTCTVQYEYKGTTYEAEIWYHVTIDVNDTLYVHVNPDNPEVPYTTFWWVVIIIAAALLEILNLTVCIIKVRSVRGGTPFR